jgi:hypothetical protein
MSKKQTKTRDLSEEEREELYKIATKTIYINFESFDYNSQGMQKYKEYLDKFDQQEKELKK